MITFAKMSDIKKHTGKNRGIRKTRTSSEVIVVTKNEVSVQEMLFPEKVARANKMLSKTKFINSP